jgi:outer membrane lipoprotein SlyB
MRVILTVLAIVPLAGCIATDSYAGNQICARTAGCVSSFSNPGYGPIQAQAVAPVSSGPLQPQR